MSLLQEDRTHSEELFAAYQGREKGRTGWTWDERQEARFKVEEYETRYCRTGNESCIRCE